MIPPVWISIRFGWFWIPVPILLFWPLFAIAWIVLGLCLTLALVLTGGNLIAIGKLWTTTWELFCALRGTSIDVQQVQLRLQVSIH